MSFLNFQRLGVFPFQAAPLRVDLLPGVNTHAIFGRITATVDVAAGGGADGTLISEGIQRMIQTFRIRHDGDDRVGLLNGRQLYQITARARREITAAVTLAGPGIATTAIAWDFELPIALPWLDDPVMTVWPGSMPVRQELAAYMQWNTAAANAQAGTVAGTGAFYTGGTRVVTFTVAPTIELVQVYSTGVIKPWYLARWTPDQTIQYAAANAQLPYLLAGGRRITAALLRNLQGAAQDATQGITNVSLVSGMGSLRYLGDFNFTMAQREDAGQFPAAEEAVQTGTFFHLITDDGWLGSALDPRPLSQPQYQFNCSAPSNPGVVDVVLSELDVLPGITQVEV